MQKNGNTHGTTLETNTGNLRDEHDGVPEAEVCLTKSTTAAPPDGGWGWLVCFACFMTHVLTDGTVYSFGIIFVELLDYYQENKGSTAVIASLSFGVCLLSGPLNAALTNHFGFRKVTIFGTILMAFSLICSIFSPNVFYLYITFGISGWGFGMVYLSSIVCVTLYFEKRRSLAVGLGVSGSGIGTFIFGFLTRALIDAYTWKGTILIQSGLMLNCVACGMVYLPLDHEVNKSNTSDGFPATIDSAKGSQLEMRLYNRSKNCGDSSNQDLSERELLNNHDKEQLSDDDKVITSERTIDMTINDKHVTELMEPIESLEYYHVTMTGSRSTIKRDKALLDEIVLALKQSFNFRVFKNVGYLLYIVSTIFYAAGYYIPYLYLPDKAEISGIDSYRSAALISSIGITNTAGRIIFGFISDMKCINRFLLYSIALVICGAGTILCPFLDSFAGLLTYTVIFGLFSGVTISLTSVIVADLVGTDLLADAFGVMNFFAGVFSFLGPPLGGWLFDVTKSYDMPFWAAGVSIVLSGAICFLLPLVRNKSC